ncbi:MAG: diacylglycerol kinase family lipid kinase [Firmicutes bacterium]|nr:diacylglycerol kinase family lipid kinase [Bacillota bacterium]
MRYVFIINPKAGKKNPREWFFPKIEAFFAEHGIPYRIRVTEYAGHATEIVREEATQGETIRAIAVGGDGTLREVACGAAGLPNVEVGLLPCGSGNDYLRIYGTKEDFLDPERLVGGQSYPVDMIESDFLPAMNVCSVGIDSQVAMDMVRYKNLPLVTGSMAYNIALLKAFCGRIGVQMKVTVDGGKHVFSGRYLLAIAAVGSYYGGGYCASPASVVDDGLLDVVLVRVPKSRLQIPGLLGIYKRGEHIGNPKFRDLLTYVRGKSVVIESEQPAAVNSDGECAARCESSFSVRPAAVRFIVPQGVRPACLSEEKERLEAALPV